MFPERVLSETSLLPKKKKDTEKEYLRVVSRKEFLLFLILLLNKIFTAINDVPLRAGSKTSVHGLVCWHIKRGWCTVGIREEGQDHTIWMMLTVG